MRFRVGAAGGAFRVSKIAGEAAESAASLSKAKRFLDLVLLQCKSGEHRGRSPVGLQRVREPRRAYLVSYVSYFGCAATRRYGLMVLNPGNFCCASSFETAAVRITSSPGFQFTGFATLCLAVSCMESMTRRISSKFRPVVMG